MIITVSKALLLKTLSFTKSIFMADNTTIGLKLVKNAPCFLLKKNEQCHGKFLVRQIPFISASEKPDAAYFFVLNEHDLYEAVKQSTSDNVIMEFSHKVIKVAGTGCAVLATKDNPAHYSDVMIPKTAQMLRTFNIECTPELKKAIDIGMPFVRATNTHDYMRIYDGVMFFEASHLSTKTTFIYSASGDHAIAQSVLGLDIPTCVLPTDILKVIASIPTNRFDNPPVVNITEYVLNEDNIHFNKYITACKYGALTILHSRKTNEYAPMHQIDYDFESASCFVETTVETIYKHINKAQTDYMALDFTKAEFDGHYYKWREAAVKGIKYEARLIRKALEVFNNGVVNIMYKDENYPLIMYNKNYIVYIKHRYRR